MNPFNDVDSAASNYAATSGDAAASDPAEAEQKRWAEGWWHRRASSALFQADL